MSYDQGIILALARAIKQKTGLLGLIRNSIYLQIDLTQIEKIFIDED